ncbi:MAG: ubiquinone/menaquinone biosynthesis methyltransferase [Rickettsiales bacterium]
MIFNQDKINNIFSDIAPSYDKMNNFMSLGLHIRWKNKFINLVSSKINLLLYNEYFLNKMHNKDLVNNIYNEDCIDNNLIEQQDLLFQNIKLKDKLSLFDCASGSCDIPILLNNKLNIRNNLEITCSDINAKMLKYGKQKLDQSYNANIVKILVADATKLPIPDKSFNFYTIVFGIRNIAEKEIALQEAFRILKPGGYFFCMEFNKPNYPFSKFYNLYAKLLPKLGQIIANNSYAYQYLSDSIVKFPAPFEFNKMIEDVGFTEVEVHNIYFGLVNIFVAKKV